MVDLKRWRVLAVIGGIIVVYLVSRLVGIDADVPPWEQSHYSQCDEGFYLNIAFFFLERHPLARAQLAEYFLADGRHHTNWLLNLVSLPGLVAFGRTHLGMRLGTVLLGLVTSLGTVGIVGQVSTAAGHTRRARVGMLLAAGYLLLDYGFLLSNRIVEPTAARMAALVLLVAWVGPRIERLAATTRGIVTVAIVTSVAWLGSYSHNVFVVPAVFAAMLWVRTRERREARARSLLTVSLGWAIGLAVAALAYVAAYRLMFGHDVIQELRFEKALNANRVAGGSASETVRAMVYHVRSLLIGSSFKLTPVLLLAWLTALPIASVGIVRSSKVNGPALVVVAMSWVLLAQLVFVNDYPERKLVLCVPLAIATLAAASSVLDEVVAWIRSAPRRRVLASVGFVAFLLVGLVSANAGSMAAAYGWTGPKGIVVLKAMGIVCFVAAVFFVLHDAPAKARGSSIACIVSAALAHLWVDVAVIHRGARHEYRDMMFELAKTVGDEPLIGGTNVCVRLYLAGGTYLTPYGFYGQEERYRAMLERALDATGARYYFEYTSDTCDLFCLPSETRTRLRLTPLKTFQMHAFGESERLYDSFTLFERRPARQSAIGDSP